MRRLEAKEQRRDQKQKEEEEKQMKRQKREEERKRKLEEKEKKAAEKKKVKKVKKAQQTDVETEVTINESGDCGEKIGRLAAKKFTCGICGERGRVTDAGNGIEWYGCDDDMCERGWYHFECLSVGEKELLRESLTDEHVYWYCKFCIPFLYDE